MTKILTKHAPIEVVPSQGGTIEVGQTGGAPGYNPQMLSGFYPTAQYAAVRQYVDGEGQLVTRPAEYVDFRLVSELLVASPPISMALIDRIIENALHGQVDFTLPYVYVTAWFNVWDPRWPQPTVASAAGFYTQDLRDGWASGAVTVDGFADGAFSFRSSAKTFGVVGLMSGGGVATDPWQIEFGFLFRGPLAVQAIERGTVHNLTTPAAPDGSATYKLDVANGVVRYLVGASVQRTSSTAPGTVFNGAACLYGATAEVIGVAVQRYSGAAAVLPALQNRHRGGAAVLALPVTEGRWFPYGYATLRPLRALASATPAAVGAVMLPTFVTGRPRQGEGQRLRALTSYSASGVDGKATLRLLASGGDRPYASAEAVLPRLQAESLTGRPYVLGAAAVLPRLRSIGTGRTAGRGTGAGVLQRLAAGGSPFARGTVTLRALRGAAYTDPAGELFISNAPFAGDPVQWGVVVLVSMTAAGALAGALAVTLTRDAEAESTVGTAGTLGTAAELSAEMVSAIFGAASVPLFDDGGTTWVINADTLASSRYEDYSFNSYAVIDGVAFGANSDGLFRLTGADDAGQPIRASVNFGSTNFRSQQIKRPENAYLGVSSTGTLYLRVTVNGQQYLYEARRSDNFMTTQRVDLGKGLRGVYTAFEIYNHDGCDFELNTATFYAAELTRRI